MSPTLLGTGATLGANQTRSLSLGGFITFGEDTHCFTNHPNKCKIIIVTNIVKVAQTYTKVRMVVISGGRDMFKNFNINLFKP